MTSTKQFIWNANDRKEERDGTGALTKKFFGRGQMNATTKYFYNSDHLGSIREMTDNTGAVQARYEFDPFGRVTKLSEAVPSDFAYAGYYLHSRSALNLPTYRVYNPDPIGEVGGINLFSYVGNNPVNFRDELGLATPRVLPPPPSSEAGKRCGRSIPCANYCNDKYPEGGGPDQDAAYNRCVIQCINRGLPPGLPPGRHWEDDFRHDVRRSPNPDDTPPVYPPKNKPDGTLYDPLRSTCLLHLLEDALINCVVPIFTVSVAEDSFVSCFLFLSIVV